MGVILQGVIFCALWAIAGCFLYRGRIGKTTKLRNIPALQGIDEAVARCVELGKNVHFTTGYATGGLATGDGPSHVAGVSVLGYVAQLCARFGVPLITSCRYTELVPLCSETVRGAYILEGKPEMFRLENVRFYGEDYSYDMSVFGSLARENIGAVMYIGAIWPATALRIGEIASLHGILAIAGSSESSGIAQSIPCSDYCLIGEELFAAGAMLSKDQLQMSSVASGDYCKALLVLFMAIGSIIVTAGINLDWLFKL